MQHLRKLSDRLTSIGNIRREPISSGSTTALCSTCSAIDVVRILRDGLRESDMVPLGFLPNVMAKANCCALCRLVATRVQQCWRLNDYPDVDLGAIACSLYSIGFGPSELAKSKKRCRRGALEPQPRPWSVFPTERHSGEYATNDGAYHKGPPPTCTNPPAPLQTSTSSERPLTSPHQPSSSPEPAGAQGKLETREPITDDMNLPAPPPRPAPTEPRPPRYWACAVPSTGSAAPTTSDSIR